MIPDPFELSGHSIYRYTASGALAGSKWVSPHTGGTIVTPPAAASADIRWDSGPIVGRASYEVNDHYVWDLEVNVVEVKFKATGNTGTYVSTPTQVGGAGSALIRSSAAVRAMEAKIELDDIVGPRAR